MKLTDFVGKSFTVLHVELELGELSLPLTPTVKFFRCGEKRERNFLEAWFYTLCPPYLERSNVIGPGTARGRRDKLLQSPRLLLRWKYRFIATFTRFSAKIYTRVSSSVEFKKAESLSGFSFELSLVKTWNFSMVLARAPGNHSISSTGNNCHV